MQSSRNEDILFTRFLEACACLDNENWIEFACLIEENLEQKQIIITPLPGKKLPIKLHQFIHMNTIVLKEPAEFIKIVPL